MMFGRWFVIWGYWGLMLNLRAWGFGVDRDWYDGPILIVSFGPLHLSRCHQNRLAAPDPGRGTT